MRTAGSWRGKAVSEGAGGRKVLSNLYFLARALLPSLPSANPPPSRREALGRMSVDLQWDSLRAAGRPCKCVLRIARMIGLCPHKKNHPLGGWMFIHTHYSARYSVLYLLGVLSGGNKPPLRKGRWVRLAVTEGL